MKKILFYTVIFTSFIAVSQNNIEKVLNKYNKNTIPYIKVNQLNNAKYIYLDARETKEFKVSHLPNAVYVGFNTYTNKKITTLIKDKNTPIVVYCSIGVRSEKIAEKIKKMGYKNVFNLYGGIFEYKNQGNKVYCGPKKETDSVHAYSKEWSAYLTKGIKVYEN